MRLRDHTRQLLLNRPRSMTIKHIATSTGLKYHFVSEFSKGRMESPCVDKIQTLYEFLTGDVERLNF